MSVPGASPDGFTILSAAANVMEIVAGVRTLWNQRAARTVESILSSADMSPEDLARAVRDNEALGDLFAMSIDLGSRTRNERKRRALGGMVGRALLHPDSALVDETELLFKAIEPLETVHIQVLDHIWWSERRRQAGGDGAPGHMLTKVVPSAAALSSVLTTLTSLGLIYSTKGLIENDGSKPLRERFYVSNFGRLMLKWLTLEEGQPLRVED